MRVPYKIAILAAALGLNTACAPLALHRITILQPVR